MSPNEMVLIEAAAAKALAEWKAMFAHNVCEHAKRLAAESSQPNLITLSHYQQAAPLALKSLVATIQNEAGRNANPRAA